MKKTKILQKSLFTLFIPLLFSGCQFLQGTLGSSQNKALKEETGYPSYAYKTWYYNGQSGEDMTSSADSSSDEYYAQTMCINFGQKAALQSLNPSGKMTVNYTDSEGYSISKSITELRGRFSSDFTSYYLDMSPVVKLIDGQTSSAAVDIKMSGFVCAQGEQKGRAITAFEYSGLQVRPLYNSYSYDFSTANFSPATTFSIPLRAPVTIKNGSYELTAKDTSLNEYTFTVSAGESQLYLNPLFTTEPADGTSLILTLNNILAPGSQDAYTKDFTVTFRKNLLVIDGIEDAAWQSSSVVGVADSSSDSVACGDDGVMYSTSADITNLSVANDDQYLYLSIKGSLTSTWSDGFVIMISKDHSSDAAYTAGKNYFDLCDTVNFGRDSLAHGKPDIYLYHKPQDSLLGAWVENGDSADDISSSVLSAADSSDTFIEYALPLSELEKAGIESSQTIYIAAFFSAHWGAGNFASDVVPDSAASSISEKHNSIIINFQKALAYSVK